jgi:hypothetical protein
VELADVVGAARVSVLWPGTGDAPDAGGVADGVADGPADGVPAEVVADEPDGAPAVLDPADDDVPAPASGHTGSR